MKLYGLLSWFDEDPDALYRNVSSLAPVVDHLIAVDGRYLHFPSPLESSPPEQHDAITFACQDYHMGLTIHRPTGPWSGGEVEKRAAMFRLALAKARPMRDWFMVVDADVQLDRAAEGWRDALTSTIADCAKVRCRNVRPDGKFIDDVTYRAFYRALPGLTVEGTHWCYVVVGSGSNARYMWMDPSARESQEYCADLTEFVTVHHRSLDRDGDRAWASREYYRKRDELSLERAPRW